MDNWAWTGAPFNSEHEREAGKRAEYSQGPVEVFPGWTPAGGIQNGQNGAGHVEGGVAHEEAYGNLAQRSTLDHPMMEYRYWQDIYV